MMFSTDSPEGRAFRGACAVDVGRVRDQADREADEAGYGVGLPEDHEAWLMRVSELAAQGHPFNGSAWRAARDRAFVRGCFPRIHIAHWFREAGVEDASAATQATADDVGLVCEVYRQERAEEGLAWKPSPQPDEKRAPRRRAGRRQLKASGLGNQELRDAVTKASSAAEQFANALHTLRDEALRPGQAGTARGARVRGLYVNTIGTLLAELTQAARLDRQAAEMLQLIGARIEVEDDRYASAQLPWESGLIGLGRWLQRRAADDRFWGSLESAHGTVSGSRDRLIGRLGSIFERASGVEPTFTGPPNRSQFLRFMAAAQGHMAGLTFSRLGNSEEARRSVEVQGLDQVFSAPTYRAAWLTFKDSSHEVRDLSSIAWPVSC